MKIKLENNQELDVLVVNANTQYIQGFQRDVLDFHIEKGLYSFEELESLFTQENTDKIYIITEEGIEYLHGGYTLRVSISLERISVQEQSQAESQEYFSVKMAQKTYNEKTLEQLQDTVDMLILSNLGGE